MDFSQVEEPAGQHLIRDPLRHRRVERHGHDFRFVSFPQQCGFQSLRVRLGAARDERYLDRGNDDPHGV
jgi:hypothetical protein